MLTVCLVTSGSPVTAGAEVDTPEGGAGVPQGGEDKVIVGGGERIVKGRPWPEVDWGPADRALREAMATDLSFGTKPKPRLDLTQAAAVAGE